MIKAVLVVGGYAPEEVVKFKDQAHFDMYMEGFNYAAFIGNIDSDCMWHTEEEFDLGKVHKRYRCQDLLNDIERELKGDTND